MKYIPKFQKGASIKRDISEKQAIVIANKIKNKQPVSEKERQDYTNVYHKLASKGIDGNGEEYLNANLPEVEVTAKRIPYTQGLPTPYKLMSGYADMTGQVINTPAAAMGELAHAVSGKEANLSRIVPQQLNPYSKHWQGNKGTGEQRTVSDAANIQNPVGRFAVDMITDPTTWTGAGVVKNAVKSHNQVKAVNALTKKELSNNSAYRTSARDYINLLSSEESLKRAKALDIEHGTKFAEIIPVWKNNLNNQKGTYNIRKFDDNDLELQAGTAGYSSWTSKGKQALIDDFDDNVGKFKKEYKPENLPRYERQIRINPNSNIDDVKKTVIPHELKHDLTHANFLLSESYKKSQEKFLTGTDNYFSKTLGDTDDYRYYSSPTELDAYLSTNMRQRMVDKKVLKNHFAELDENQLDDYLKSEDSRYNNEVSVIGDKPEQRKAFVDWFNKALPAVGTGVIANEALKDKKQLGGSISELGYKDNSPYKNAKQLPIYSPNGTITMDGVSQPLEVTDVDNNETRILNPNSGTYRFKGNNFIEKPLNNMIHNNYKPTDKLLWQEAFNKAKLKHGGYAQPNEIVNKAMDIYAAKRGGWIMKAQSGAYTEPDYSAAPKPERNIFNSNLYQDEDKAFQDDYSGINPEVFERYAAESTRLAPGTVTNNPSMMSGNTQSKNNQAFNRAADANFEANDRFKNYQGRISTSEDIDYNDEIFSRGSNSPMQGYPNSEKTKMYERKFQSDYRGKPVLASETVENRTGGGERRGDKTASSSKGASGNMFLNQDLRDYGYTDENGGLTEKALNVLSEADRTKAREMGMSAKELLSNEDLGDDSKEYFRQTILQKGLGKDRANNAAYMNARKTMNETLKHLDKINPVWRELSKDEKARLSNIENKNEFIQKFGDDLRTISDYRSSYGREVDRKPVVTADVDANDTNRNRFETSGNVNNKPNAFQGNEQGSRYNQATQSPGNSNRPRTGSGSGRRSSSSGKGLPSKRPSTSYERGARKNMSEVRANGNATSNLKTVNTDLKGSTYTPKSYKAVGSTLKRKEGGYSYNYDYDYNHGNNTMGGYSNEKATKYSPGDLVYYQKGGNIEQGVVKFYDSSTGKVHLH